jgi:superfamily II DNA or RNA helicase
MPVELTEAFFAKIAGWEAMKQARSLLAADKVLSSNWAPPVLKGVVQEGTSSYRAGLVLHDERNIENLCGCRASRDSGMICAHSVAVGLHWLKQTVAPTAENSERAGARGAKAQQPTTAASSAQGKSPLRIKRAPDSGEPAELFLILPPNLEAALARGKVMLCFEAKWRGGRTTPLNALPQPQTFRFSEQDSDLLDFVETFASGETPALLLLESKDFGDLLPRLVGHPRVTLGKSTAVTVEKTPWPPLKAAILPGGEIDLSLKEKPVAPHALVSDKWVYHPNAFHPLGLSREFLQVLNGPLRLSRAQVPQFLMEAWPALHSAGAIEANFALEDFSFAPQPPRFLLELKGGLAQLHALLQCAYGPRIMSIGTTSQDEAVWLPDPTLPTRYSTRDLAAERSALTLLLRAGFSAPDAEGRCHLLGQEKVLNFFARDFPKLQRQWQVTLEERLERSTAQNVERIEPRFEITPSGVEWFDLGVNFQSASGERFSAADIQRLVLSGQSHTRLKNGKLAVIDTGAVEELQQVLLDCAPQQHAGGFRLNNTQAGFLDATLRETGWKVQSPAEWNERVHRQRGDGKLECPPLGDLETVLRPYQKTGVAWLHFLRENNFGGILADEMGLGKTLQTLALLQTRFAECGGSRAQHPMKPDRSTRSLPGLIVSPTSLVFNWLAEAQKFTPGLKALVLEGPNRHSLFEQIPEHDLVITSYALIRRDADRYREFEFDTIVLDEAQHIKNRQTQNAQAVKAIRARHRLVLTGTPLENSVLDLWSIFDFLMPGYLGTAQDFRERYEAPLTRGNNEQVQARLARRLRPFILRRLKREVAPELPPKLEQISFCDLTQDQTAVYQQVIEASRREVFQAVGAQGLAKSRMVVLNALLRLRQVCCDLRLLKLENIDPATASGKLEMFGELLEEILDGGHRALVFSQFVSMLSLLREKLAADGVEFCYLDGSTSNRAEVVERFQTRPEIPVFLISLKAGGVGLNLTGADTVIHFDPWWNPAVEAQASARAHRIGQTKVVTSYKLITRNTVEEKILALQNRKREILQSVLGGEEQLAEALTWDEIQDLLR